MIEVLRDLYVGDERDYECCVRGQSGWRIVHACKEPYHRQALSYSGRAAPSTHPEYLLVYRDDRRRLILNLVDAPDPRFFSPVIFDAALEFIREGLDAGDRVLVHCNEGESRGPSIGLLYLAAVAKAIPCDSLEAAEEAFRALYPAYLPGKGVRGFLAQNWRKYCG